VDKRISGRSNGQAPTRRAVVKGDQKNVPSLGREGQRGFGIVADRGRSSFANKPKGLKLFKKRESKSRGKLRPKL